MNSKLVNSIARITSGKSRGTGFLVNDNFIITCNHVIKNRNDISVAFADQYGDFCYRVNVLVENYLIEQQGDIAVLKVIGSLPEHIKPLPVAETANYSMKNPFSSYGFPVQSKINGLPFIDGKIVATNIRGEHNHPIIHLTNTNDISHGFSGAPIYDDDLQEVIGVLCAVAKEDGIGRGTAMGFGVPIDLLRARFSEIFAKEIEVGNFELPKELTALNSVDEEDLIGREKDIDHIHKMLQKNKRVCVLQGIGGIGKTNVALGYIEKYKSQYDYVGWINVSISIVENFIQQIGSVVHNFKYNNNKKITDNFSALIEILKKQTRGSNLLLVIDNADKIEEFKYSILKQFEQSGWNILFTSRVVPDDDYACTYALKKLDRTYTKQIFYRHHKEKKDDESLDKLLDLIHDHTLVTKLIAKAGRRFSVAELYQIIKKDNINASKLQAKFRIKKEDTKLNIATYLVEKVFDVKDYKFTEIQNSYLRYFSVLPSSNISFSDLCKLFLIAEDGETAFWNDLDDLFERGWLIKGRDDKGATFRMHPIIQDVLRVKLIANADFCEDLIKGTTSSLSAHPNDDIVKKGKYIPIGESIIRYLDLKEESIGNLALFLATRYSTLSQFNNAIELLKKCISEKYRSNNLNRHIHSSLAGKYWEIGQYSKAKNSIALALDMQTEEDSIDYYLESTLYNRLGLIQHDLSNDIDAVKSYQESIRLIEKSNVAYEGIALGKATRMHNMGFVYFYGLNERDKGIEILEKSKDIRVEFGGTDFRGLGNSYSSLCKFYSDIGIYGKALEYADESIRITALYFSKDNLNWAYRYSNKCYALYGLERFEEALDLINKSLYIRVKYLGENNISNWDIYELKAEILYKLSLMDEAKHSAVQALKCYKRKSVCKPEVIEQLEALIRKTTSN